MNNNDESTRGFTQMPLPDDLGTWWYEMDWRVPVTDRYVLIWTNDDTISLALYHAEQKKFMFKPPVNYIGGRWPFCTYCSLWYVKRWAYMSKGMSTDKKEIDPFIFKKK